MPPMPIGHGNAAAAHAGRMKGMAEGARPRARGIANAVADALAGAGVDVAAVAAYPLTAPKAFLRSSDRLRSRLSGVLRFRALRANRARGGYRCENQAHRAVNAGRREDREVLRRDVRMKEVGKIDDPGRAASSHRWRHQPRHPQFQERYGGRERARQELLRHPPHRLSGREPRCDRRAAHRSRIAPPP